MAQDVEDRFIRFGIPVIAYSDPHRQYISASLAEEGDVLCVGSMLRQQDKLTENMKKVRLAVSKRKI